MTYSEKERLENALAAHLDFISRQSLLTPEEEREITQKIVDESLPEWEREEARRKLAESNLRLVVSIAKRYKNLNIPLADLISEGNVGLLIAIERFKPELGYKFSTYATWWIKQRILRYITKNHNLIRVPEHVFERVHKIRKAQDAFRREHGREPTTEEIAEVLGMTVEEVERYHNSIPFVMSLDTSFEHSDGNESAEEGRELKERIPASEEDGPQKVLNTLQIRHFLAQLTDLERQVIIKRYGLTEEGEESYDPPMTLKEVARLFGMGRERVRQIERRALNKMRRWARQTQLRIEKEERERRRGYIP